MDRGAGSGGGYTANAAINDRRIRAVGTISAVNIGSMFRNGWDNNIKSADAIPVLENGSKARTAEGSGAASVTVPLAPLRKEGAANKESEEAWEHYRTPTLPISGRSGRGGPLLGDALSLLRIFARHPSQH